MTPALPGPGFGCDDMMCMWRCVRVYGCLCVCVFVVSYGVWRMVCMVFAAAISDPLNIRSKRPNRPTILSARLPVIHPRSKSRAHGQTRTDRQTHTHTHTCTGASMADASNTARLLVYLIMNDDEH